MYSQRLHIRMSLLRQKGEHRIDQDSSIWKRRNRKIHYRFKCSGCIGRMGLKVMQIGCDPKADSTILLRHGEAVPAVLDLYNEKKQALQLEDMIRIGYNGVICVEAGGPTPGLGCAGRGIITALEKLKELGAYDVYKPDVVLYDVLGDVVCGGFSMPMRGGYADKIFIITSGENMAIHAAANIAMAVENFKNRGYARLGGLILNRRDVPREEEKVAELADDFHTAVIGTLSHSGQVALAEEQKKTLMECYPTGEWQTNTVRLPCRCIAYAVAFWKRKAIR